MKLKPPLEKEIQNTICEYLSYNRKILFWRQNTAALFREGRHFAMPKFSLTGIPDIIVIGEGGQFIGIEVKRPGGKQSDNQIEFQKKCEQSGGIYIIAERLEDVQKIGL